VYRVAVPFLFLLVVLVVGCSSKPTKPTKPTKSEVMLPDSKWAGVYSSFCRENGCPRLSQPTASWLITKTDEPVEQIPELTV